MRSLIVMILFFGLASCLNITGDDINSIPKSNEPNGSLRRLFAAIKNGNMEAVQELIKDQDVNAADELDGSTALHEAAINENEKIVEWLIGKGAHVNKVRVDGSTPLLGSAFRGYEKNAELLIKNGADVNLANKNGATPIDIAAFSGHEKFVELLIKNGANITLTDKNGRSALHYAADSGQNNIIHLLFKSGADRNSMDKLGKTASDVIKNKENLKFVEPKKNDGNLPNSRIDLVFFMTILPMINMIFTVIVSFN